jgi:hypothetical protein
MASSSSEALAISMWILRLYMRSIRRVKLKRSKKT